MKANWVSWEELRQYQENKKFQEVVVHMPLEGFPEELVSVVVRPLYQSVDLALNSKMLKLPEQYGILEGEKIWLKGAGDLVLTGRVGWFELTSLGEPVWADEVWGGNLDGELSSILLKKCYIRFAYREDVITALSELCRITNNSEKESVVKKSLFETVGGIPWNVPVRYWSNVVEALRTLFLMAKDTAISDVETARYIVVCGYEPEGVVEYETLRGLISFYNRGDVRFSVATVLNEVYTYYVDKTFSESSFQPALWYLRMAGEKKGIVQSLRDEGIKPAKVLLAEPVELGRNFVKVVVKTENLIALADRIKNAKFDDILSKAGYE